MRFALAEIEPPIRVRLENPMSDAEFMSFCAVNEPLRFERDANGEIIVMSPTGTGGGRFESRVYLELGTWARADGRGEALDLPPASSFQTVRCGPQMLPGSLSANALTPQNQEGYARICPEFVIEVRSETDRLAVLQEKMALWLTNGAELGWLIDPSRKVVEIYRPGQEPEYLVEPSSIQGDGPVAGFELDPARIWG